MVLKKFAHRALFNSARRPSDTASRLARLSRRSRLRLEPLEERTLLSGSSLPQVVEYDLLTGIERVQPVEQGVPNQAVQQLQSEPGGPQEWFDAVPQDGVGTSSVHGPDDRVRVTNPQTQADPWRRVGRARIRFGAFETWCSGTMVNPFQFLTAGHCIHNPARGGFATYVGVALGRDRAISPFGEANSTFIRSYLEWTRDRDPDHDWALVSLDRRIGNFSSWLGARSQSNAWFNGNGLTSAGYPEDRSLDGIEMYRIAGPSAFATGDPNNAKGRVFYTGTMDTAGGQSGSGVWDSGLFNVAVHAYGGATNNSGTRLIQEKVNRLITWFGEDQSARPPTDRPDLVDYDSVFQTSFASFSPSVVRPGQNLFKRAIGRNNGTATAGAFRISFYASDNDVISTGDHLLGSVNFSSLTPFSTFADAQLNSAFPTIPAGQYFFGWIIDPLNQVTEFNEGNNTGVIRSSRISVLPTAPSFLNSTPISASQINLNWADVAGETGYRIERGTDGVNWGFVTNVGANVTSFANTGLASGTRYFYRVRGFTGAGEGNNSPTASTTTFVAAPASLSATAASSSRINLSWSDVFGESSYRVERSPNGSSSWAFLGSTGANVTTFADTSASLAIGTRYFYRVNGVGVSGLGAFSPTASALTLSLGGFTYTGMPAGVAAASPFSFTMTARDTGGNVATNYVGTVTFSSSDGAASLPPNTSFAGFSGVRTFTNQTTLRTPGSQTVRVADTVSGAFAVANVNVTPIAVTSNGTGVGDTFLLRNQGGNSNLYELLVNGGVQSQGWWISLSSITINGLGGPDTFIIERVRTGLPVTVNGGDGNDTITVSNSLSSIAGSLTVNGEGDSDTLNVNDQTAPAAQDLFLTASTVRRTGTGTVTYGSLETLNVTASSGGDSGLNVASTAPGMTINFTGAGADYLFVPADGSSVVITGANSGTLNGVGLASEVLFTGVGNVIGGAGDDTVAFADGQGISGYVEGRGGLNSLDYSLWTSGVYVDLSNYVAFQGAAAIYDIVYVFGGEGDDFIHGDFQDNWIVGNGGHDILIGDEGGDWLQGGEGADQLYGGNGFDQLDGGNGEDLLFGGPTAYDNDVAALSEIWTEWTNAGLLYEERIAILRSGTPSGYVLDATTVFEDADADLLNGEGDLDWFWGTDGFDVMDRIDPDEVLN